MKIITKKEWDNTPEEYKRFYEGTPYMVYKEGDGSLYFGPVRIKDENKIIDSRRLIITRMLSQ